MATGDKKRASYITPLELDVLMQSYKEYEHIFRNKSNTTVATKEREAAWEEIAARVNARNLGGEKRTWQQLKMKHKNIVQSANRKKADYRRTGGGPTPPEETTKNQSPGPAPLDDGVPGGSSCATDSSAFIRCSDGILCFVEPHAPAELITDDEEDNKDGLKTLVLSAATSGNPESTDEQPQETGASPTPIAQLPMQELNRMYLIKKMTKMDKEMMFLDRQIQKADLEIEMLQHQLEEIKKTK